MQRCFTALSSLLVLVSQLFYCFRWLSPHLFTVKCRHGSIVDFFKDWYKWWSEAWEAGEAVKWWLLHQRGRFSPWRTLERLRQGKLREEKTLWLFCTADIVVNQSWMRIGEMFLYECSLKASYAHSEVDLYGGRTPACDWWRASPVASSGRSLCLTEPKQTSVTCCAKIPSTELNAEWILGFIHQVTLM